MTQVPKTKVTFAITHNISSSKGWGRYKASTTTGKLIESATGNEWVSAGHVGEVEFGAEITVTLQTMERTGKQRKENINTTAYRLIADGGSTAKVGFWNGLEVEIIGARLA